MRETNPAKYRITDLDESERPRERLLKHGAQALSNAELIAILLRVGVEGENAVEVGQRLLQEYDGIQGLHRIDPQLLKKAHGLGMAKVATLKAAIELGRRLDEEEAIERFNVSSPGDAAKLVQYDMQSLEKEQIRVILLDTRNKVLEIVQLTQGSVNASVMRVSEVFTEALRKNATSVIVAHNHPSGDPTPSPEDVAITKKLIEAGKIMEIEVLDHIIIGQGRFISMKERGLGFGG